MRKETALKSSLLPHIKLRRNTDFKRVIVCGAPERAKLIASYLKHPKLIAQNREYHSYLGIFKNKPVLVTSHGVGAAGAAICFQELIQSGAKYIIRVGTAGGLYPSTQIGDIVIADSAVRLEGTSSLMIPSAYPAVPDLSLTNILIGEIKKSHLKAKVGTILTTDLFYTGLLDNQLKLYSQANVIAVDMEAATLFVTGRLNAIKTGAIFALDGNPLSKKLYKPHAKVMQERIATLSIVALNSVAGIE